MDQKKITKKKKSLKKIRSAEKFRYKIIDTIRKEIRADIKSDEETEDKSVDLSWLKHPDNFEELIIEYNIQPNFG